MMKWMARSNTDTIYNNLIDTIGEIRGIEDMEEFLNPKPTNLHFPNTLRKIDEVRDRIIQAIKNNESVVISYDVDADGVTSGTIMRKYLENYVDDVEYIYSQREDGHGIKEQVLLRGLDEEEDAERISLNTKNNEKIKNADLLIIVDSSSTEDNFEVCRKIKEHYDTDVLIIDHHKCKHDGDLLMVNPNHPDCEYPNKELSGAGVVFKVIQYTEEKMGNINPFDYIDLVAVGMYADRMDMRVLENRYLVMHGLRNMKNTGLVRILKGAKQDLYNLNADSIGFGISPMINAVARMGDIELAIKILHEDDDKECKKLRLKMNKMNEERKEITKNLFEKYSVQVDKDDSIIVITDEESNKGFNGLIAERISSHFKKPTIVGRKYKGYISGSYRSVGNFKLQSFLEDFCEDVELGGHEGAGGISFPEDELDNLKEYAERFLPEFEEDEGTILYDLEMSVKDIINNVETMEKINLVTGRGFPKVKIRLTDALVDERVVLGKLKNTIKISLMGNNSELIKFKVDDEYGLDLNTFTKIEAIGELKMNRFYNFKTKELKLTPQIIIEDYIKA